MDVKEMKDKLEQLGKAFEAYKGAIDERVSALENGDSTAEIDAKIDRIAQDYTGIKEIVDKHKAEQEAMAESLANLNREGRLGSEAKNQLDIINKFGKQAREGIKSLADFAKNTMQTNVNTDGGYVVMPDVEQAIYRYGRNANPVKGLITVKQISGNAYESPISNDICATSWTGEGGAMSNTDTETLEMISIPAGTLYAFPRTTLEMIQDAYINVASEIQDSVGIAINEAENAAYTNGTGQNKRPKGFLKYATAATADATRDITKIQHIATGSSGAFASTPGDWQKLMDVVMALKSPYRANAVWQMNALTAATVWKIGDDNNAPVWQPSLQAGVPDRLLGYPVVLNEDMPAIAANSLSIAFGDWRRAYIGVEKPGMYLEYDPYTGRPFIQWDFRKRVGGGVRDTSAYKVLKFAAS